MQHNETEGLFPLGWQASLSERESRWSKICQQAHRLNIPMQKLLGDPAIHQIPSSDFTVPRYLELEKVWRIVAGSSLEKVCFEVVDQVETLEIATATFYKAAEVPGKCKREARDEYHNLVIFTNQRVIQFYCVHNLRELERIIRLDETDRNFRVYPPFVNTDRSSLQYNDIWGPPYEQHTRDFFAKARRYLACECPYPEGIDMAALSPLDVNVNVKSKPAPGGIGKPPSAPAAKPTTAKPTREKDHPPPPPIEVQEPRSYDRPNGAVYQTGKLLGKGGFAICYEGVLTATREVYALKIVKSRMPQKKMEQKFQTELQIHSKMHHPNIVEFYRAFTYEESTYIVLEVCPNGSLMDMVKKRRYITEPEVRYYTIQIAGAIKYMHSKGIIHRDLKMGNIFLDNHMNVKIGDFGLAALLISGKDMATVRRTTLCGTPNYIAPEILEKGKKGHDQAVDIWSLGIIIFAMLTGRPPFQSSTQDEIYRKARERDYDWPAMEKTNNRICQEAKDLVASMLQPADERPDCDTIVQHKFFSCGYVPAEIQMTVSLKDYAPDPSKLIAEGLRRGRTALYEKNLKAICIKSDVGPWSRELKLTASLYREMGAEEKHGLTPRIPLAAGIVYRPFDLVVKEEKEKRELGREVVTRRSGVSVDLERPLAHRPSPVRAPLQSFAAQQRAQNVPVNSVMAPPRRPKSNAAPDVVPRVSRSQTEPEMSERREFDRHPSIESNRATSEMSAPPRRPRSQAESAASSRTSRLAAPLTSASSTSVSSSESESDKVTVEERLGNVMARDLARTKSTRSQITLPSRSPKSEYDTMFSPWERAEMLSGSHPLEVLDRLQKFHDELARALNSRSFGTVQPKEPREQNLVVKWVDYTNKFGLGYILNDGSVGCIFRALPCAHDSKIYVPPCSLVVRHAEAHLQNRENKKYQDRNQLVPITNGLDIEFYENRGAGGMIYGSVPAKSFATSTEAGKIGRLMRGKDEWDDRKREKIVLWKKFANYMTIFGRDSDYPYDDTLNRAQETHSGNVVTFYQRFGDVGIWGFRDGSFQFNFPDHTKLVLSADGSWCDFYHLPMDAARDLAEAGTIPPAALDDRQHLSYSTQAFLNFMAKPRARRPTPEINPMIQGIPEVNDFRRKIDFIKRVVKEWIDNCGIGCSSYDPETRLRWNGYRELVNVKAPYKHVWVTVGAYNGDDRRVAWFDPKEPEKIVPDIE